MRACMRVRVRLHLCKHMCVYKSVMAQMELAEHMGAVGTYHCRD